MALGARSMTAATSAGDRCSTSVSHSVCCQRGLSEANARATVSASTYRSGSSNIGAVPASARRLVGGHEPTSTGAAAVAHGGEQVAAEVVPRTVAVADRRQHAGKGVGHHVVGFRAGVQQPAGGGLSGGAVATIELAEGVAVAASHAVDQLFVRDQLVVRLGRGTLVPAGPSACARDCTSVEQHRLVRRCSTQYHESTLDRVTRRPPTRRGTGFPRCHVGPADLGLRPRRRTQVGSPARDDAARREVLELALSAGCRSSATDDGIESGLTGRG